MTFKTSVKSKAVVFAAMQRQTVTFVFVAMWLFAATGETTVSDSTTSSENNEPPSSSTNGKLDRISPGRFESEVSKLRDRASSASNAPGLAAGRGGSWTVARGGRTSKRILVVDCLMDGSHTHIQRIMARELAHRGHNVTWLTTKALLYWPTEEDKKLINFRVFETPKDYLEDRDRNLNYWTRKSLSGELSSFYWYAKMWLGKPDEEVQHIFEAVEGLMRDFFQGTNFDELRAANFDLVLCEVMSPACSSVAHDILRVPFVNTVNGGFLGTRYSRWAGQPSPLAYVPEFVTGYTDVMSFSERVRNFLVSATTLLIYDYVLFAAVDRARAQAGLDTRLGTREIMTRSELFILNWDFHIEFPRPISPNTIVIGGLTIGPPKPLPQNFEDFIQGSGEHGVVIFSVSTLLNVMDMDMAEMIAAALARLPQRVIWKYLGEERPAALGNNTMVVPWISQMDLMAHEKTRLLIYHGGLNGGYEAMYYGVPILGIPLFTDQVDDLVRLKHHVGMADYFPRGIRGLTSEELYQGIRRVLDDPSYRENAKRASAKLRDSQGERGVGEGLPLAQTARWIEYAMEHGTAHLQTKRGSLAWYQHILLDVACIYIAAIGTVLWVLNKCCSCCWGRRSSKLRLVGSGE